MRSDAPPALIKRCSIVLPRSRQLRDQSGKIVLRRVKLLPMKRTFHRGLFGLSTVMGVCVGEIEPAVQRGRPHLRDQDVAGRIIDPAICRRVFDYYREKLKGQSGQFAQPLIRGSAARTDASRSSRRRSQEKWH